MQARSRWASIAALSVLITAAACDSQTGPEDAGDPAVLMSIAGMTAGMRPAVLSAGERHVQSCSAGGRLVVEGSTTVTGSDEGSSNAWDLIMSHESCALVVNGRTVVSDGAMHLWGEARHGPPANQVAPILYQQSFQVGSLTTTFDDRSSTCAYDLAHVYDADRGDYRISGTICGRSISIRAPARP
jgi:hypothetical protein